MYVCVCIISQVVFFKMEAGRLTQSSGFKKFVRNNKPLKGTERKQNRADEKLNGTIIQA